MSADVRDALVEACTHFYQKGWMVGTAGNLSMKDGDDSFWITASGRSKGRLSRRDFIRVSKDGEVVERLADTDKPSAETSIHQAVYRLFPQTRACYHVHTIDANLVARMAEGNSVDLPTLEMLKGLGLWDENSRARLLVIDNHHDVPEIARDLERACASGPPDVPGFLIRDHGLTVWAESSERAFHYVELFEYIFRFMVRARELGLA